VSMQGNRKSRRAMLSLTAAGIAGALVLSACGGGSSAGEEGDVTLRFTWWGSDTRHAMTQELIEKFEQKNPGITIEGEFTGWDDYWDRLATNVAGRNIPDIMQQDSRYVREYSDRGALLDLNAHLGDTIDDSALDESVLGTGEVDGATYALPTGVNAFSVVVDPVIMKQAGVEVPDDTSWNWEEMVQTFAEVSKGTPKNVHGMQNFGFVETHFEVFARERGEALFDENGGPGFSADTLREWWTLMLESRDLGAEPQPSLTVETQAGGIDQSLLSTNRGAAGFWWTNEYPTLFGSSGHDLELLRFPTDNGQLGMYLKPAMFWAVSSQTEHPEEAAKFVDFLVNDPEAAALQLTDRGLPVNLELREQIEGDLDEANQKAAQFLAEITPELEEPPAVPPQGAGEVQAIMQQLTEQLLFDQITVDEAVERFIKEVSAVTG
jgi:multiple sugar transport system substrate-binding protein